MDPNWAYNNSLGDNEKPQNFQQAYITKPKSQEKAI